MVLCYLLDGFPNGLLPKWVCLIHDKAYFVGE
jgi:hypothetical protein